MINRRNVLIGGLSTVAASALLARRREAHAQSMAGGHDMQGMPGMPHMHDAPPPPATNPPGSPAASPGRLVTPNGSSLAHRVVGGVKVFHLVANAFRHTIASGLEIDAWGYNGSTPGPTIEATEGDRVRIYVTNRLPEPTTVHWHGMAVPNGMDGVAGLTQPPIQPGRTARYEFTLTRAGTFMYHPHFDEMIQMALGMMGMFVVHPRGGRTVDRDFAIMLSEWKVIPGTHRPNVLAMNDFNVLTMNSKAFPGTAPLMVQRGERVRIRFGNLGAMDHHPIHIHGFAWKMTATDGGPVPVSAQHPETTVLVPVGTTRNMEFVADVSGDWAMHCHMTHHVMNQMGHEAPNTIGVRARAVDRNVQRVLPDYMTMGSRGMGDMGEMGMPVPENSIPMMGGVGPFGHIDMGGMFTVVKVRDRLEPGAESGWYSHPSGTVAREATAEELRADGIEV